MSVAFCVVFEDEVPPHGIIGGDHLLLSKRYDELDSVAQEAGLATLTSFMSQDPEDLEEFLEDDAGQLELPPMEWFDPEDGLKAVESLIGFLDSNPKSITKSKEILEDLKVVKSELEAAVRENMKFHFSIVM
jgi:hypothetical protein